jgi:hypothetical protein
MAEHVESCPFELSHLFLMWRYNIFFFSDDILGLRNLLSIGASIYMFLGRLEGIAAFYSSSDVTVRRRCNGLRMIG